MNSVENLCWVVADLSHISHGSTGRRREQREEGSRQEAPDRDGELVLQGQGG